MSQRHRETRADFTGGYNSRDHRDVLSPTESPDMLNVMINKRGTMEPRPGVERYIDEPVVAAGKPVTSIHKFVQQDGTLHFLAFSDGELKRASDSSWDLLMGGFTPKTHLEFINHPIMDRALFVNGADGYYEYDGTSVGIVTDYYPTETEINNIGPCVIPDAPRLIEYFDWRVWLANITGFPDRIYYNLEDIEGNVLYNYYTSWSWLRASNAKGEGITAIKTFRDNLYIFTRTTTKSIRPTARFDPNGDYSPPAYEIRDVSHNVGAVSQRSVVSLGGILMFLGTDGVYIFNGYDAPRKISQRIDYTTNNVRKDYWDQVCAVVHDGRYYLSIPVETDEW